MATRAWPTTRAFAAAQLALSVQVSASRSAGFFTGVVTTRSNLADRLRATLTLPPCSAAAAAEREAFLLGIASTGDYISMALPHRLTRRGTMAGSPVVTSNTAAGSRSLPVTTTAGATLLAGDWFAVGGNLLQCAYAGAVANGAGAMTVPLVLPTQEALTAGAAITYAAPVGTWQLDDSGLELFYTAPVIQGGIALPLLQVIV